MSDDHSPGDRRQPYADRGGPEARHAETHDVRREELTNPKGPEAVDESFAEDLAPDSPEAIRLAQMEGAPAGDDKSVVDALPELNQDDLSQLSILAPGTPLEQGGVYLDLNDRVRGAYKAIGGQQVGDSEHIVAKKTTSYELWNRIAGIDDSPDIERPG
jgi:hypothetical protein